MLDIIATCRSALGAGSATLHWGAPMIIGLNDLHFSAVHTTCRQRSATPANLLRQRGAGSLRVVAVFCCRAVMPKQLERRRTAAACPHRAVHQHKAALPDRKGRLQPGANPSGGGAIAHRRRCRQRPRRSILLDTAAGQLQPWQQACESPHAVLSAVTIKCGAM